MENESPMEVDGEAGAEDANEEDDGFLSVSSIDEEIEDLDDEDGAEDAEEEDPDYNIGDPYYNTGLEIEAMEDDARDSFLKQGYRNNTKPLSRRFLLSLSLQYRLKMWLFKNSQVNRFLDLSYLASGYSKKELLETLPLYAHLVQGLWVSKSALLYKGKEAAIRDYILYEFSLKPTSKLERLKGVDERIKTALLKPLAVERPILRDWKFKEPTDHTFIREHPDIVKQQEDAWSGRLKKFMCGNVPESLAHGAKDKPKTKAEPSLPHKTREHLKKVLLMLFQEKRTHSMNSLIDGLRGLAISNSSLPIDEPKSKAPIDAATVGASASISDELEHILSDIAVKVNDVYVLRSRGNEALN